MCYRLKVNKARDLLSVEQNQQQLSVQQHKEQQQRQNILAGVQPVVGADNAQINEETFDELVQSHQQSEKERFRSPDMDRSPEIKFEKHNESKTNTDGRHIGENPLLSEITKLEQLEMEKALAASQENKSLCCDIAENKNLSTLLIFFLVDRGYFFQETGIYNSEGSIICDI
uniref:Uncharacterized protein n=1 Tax=Parascaris equorum TaxID=6256 RepID=A0A914RWX3_PAREQ